MSARALTDYLGADVSELLKIPPFSRWEVTKSTEEDLPNTEVWYEFEGHGVEVICDDANRIRTIFLRRGDGETLFDVPFFLSRREVLVRFGTPSESGDPVRLAKLGEHGAWDRFTRPNASIHFQYRADRDEIDMITLMRLDAVP